MYDPMLTIPALFDYSLFSQGTTHQKMAGNHVQQNKLIHLEYLKNN
jgi:hypothetical protein